MRALSRPLFVFLCVLLYALHAHRATDDRRNGEIDGQGRRRIENGIGQHLPLTGDSGTGAWSSSLFVDALVIRTGGVIGNETVYTHRTATFGPKSGEYNVTNWIIVPFLDHSLCQLPVAVKYRRFPVPRPPRRSHIETSSSSPPHTDDKPKTETAADIAPVPSAAPSPPATVGVDDHASGIANMFRRFGHDMYMRAQSVWQSTVHLFDGSKQRSAEQTPPTRVSQAQPIGDDARGHQQVISPSTPTNEDNLFDLMNVDPLNEQRAHSILPTDPAELNCPYNVDGNIVLLHPLPNCTYVQQAYNAMLCNATGVVIGIAKQNNELVTMDHADGDNSSLIHIPAISVSEEDYALLKHKSEHLIPMQATMNTTGEDVIPPHDDDKPTGGVPALVWLFLIGGCIVAIGACIWAYREMKRRRAVELERQLLDEALLTHAQLTQEQPRGGVARGVDASSMGSAFSVPTIHSSTPNIYFHTSSSDYVAGGPSSGRIDRPAQQTDRLIPHSQSYSDPNSIRRDRAASGRAGGGAPTPSDESSSRYYGAPPDMSSADQHLALL